MIWRTMLLTFIPSLDRSSSKCKKQSGEQAKKILPGIEKVTLAN